MEEQWARAKQLELELEEEKPPPWTWVELNFPWLLTLLLPALNCPEALLKPRPFWLEELVKEVEPELDPLPRELEEAETLPWKEEEEEEPPPPKFI